MDSYALHIVLIITHKIRQGQFTPKNSSFNTHARPHCTPIFHWWGCTTVDGMNAPKHLHSTQCHCCLRIHVRLYGMRGCNTYTCRAAMVTRILKVMRAHRLYITAPPAYIATPILRGINVHSYKECPIISSGVVYMV